MSDNGDGGTQRVPGSSNMNTDLPDPARSVGSRPGRVHARSNVTTAGALPHKSRRRTHRPRSGSVSNFESFILTQRPLLCGSMFVAGTAEHKATG